MPQKQLSLVRETDEAMRASAERMTALRPETVIVVAPHGVRTTEANTVSLCHSNAVNLGVWYPWRQDELRSPGDPELASAILDAAHAGSVPSVGLIYGATSDPVYPMDWSITAPLRYLKEAGYEGNVLPITFSGLPLETEWAFGGFVAHGISTSGRRVGFIASSDLSHVHSVEGPYGVDPIAPEFDATIEAAVRANDLRSLTNLDPEWVSRAAQDGLRSILIMGGAIADLEFSSEVLAYEVLIYFGMMTAWFGSR